MCKYKKLYENLFEVTFFRGTPFCIFSIMTGYISTVSKEDVSMSLKPYNTAGPSYIVTVNRKELEARYGKTTVNRKPGGAFVLYLFDDNDPCTWFHFVFYGDDENINNSIEKEAEHYKKKMNFKSFKYLKYQKSK
jgi:hypothetical protein